MSHILTVHKSKSDSHCGDSRLLYIIGICLHNVKNGGTLQIVYCGVPPSSYDEFFFADFPRFLERRGLSVVKIFDVANDGIVFAHLGDSPL